MPPTLSPDDLKFRELIVKLDGVQCDIAETLGLTVHAIQERLRGQKHSAWWADFKGKRARRRKRLRERRYYQNRKTRLAEAQKRLGEDPAVALARDLLDRL